MVIVLLGMAGTLAQRRADAITSYRAYVVTKAGEVHGYRVGRSGGMSPIRGNAAVTRVSGGFPIMLRFHPSGRFAYAVSVRDQMHKATLWTFRVAGDGTLRRTGARRLRCTIGQIVLHPGGHLLYAVAEGNRILPFRIDARTGALTPLPTIKDVSTFTIGIPVGATSEAELIFHPQGRAAYLFTGTGFVDHSENTLQRYRVGRNGALTAVGAPLSISYDGKPADQTGPIRGFSHGGRYAYAEGIGGGVVTYRVRSTDDALSVMLPSAEPPAIDATAGTRVNGGPRVASVDPRGRSLYLVGYATEAETATVPGALAAGAPVNVILTCRIGGDGKPRQVSRTVVREPWLLFGISHPPPDGRHLNLRPLAYSAQYRTVGIADLVFPPAR
jgi:hypothetical protein